MQTLNLPAYDARVRQQGARQEIYDPLRRKYVRLTPEEWVRQHVVQFLLRERGVPAGLVAVEHPFTYQNMTRRADVVVHDRQGRPLLVAECKAPGVRIRQGVFDQIGRYNRVLRVRYLLVTNGLTHYCCAIDRAQGAYRFLPDIPSYDALLSGSGGVGERERG